VSDGSKMHYIDVFNGDADGICALVQLRRSNPQNATLVTGVKRDVSLLKQVEFVNSAHITVLDISFKKNVKAVERLLKQGAKITYIDHHQTGKLLECEYLHIDIDLSVDTCTSLIVDKQLQGQYRTWALTAAFGDNLSDKAMALGLESGLMHEELVQLKEFGTYLNYNSYGVSVNDLFYSPSELFQKLVKFDCPFEFLQQDIDVFKTLSEAYKHDMEKANNCSFIHESDNTAVIQLPNEQWANRVSGVYSNELANRYPDRAHAIITEKGIDDFLVSVRAPHNNKQGADVLVSQFPTGGGRKAAAGINALPKKLLKAFISAFDKQYA
jgi:hypothetical protein